MSDGEESVHWKRYADRAKRTRWLLRLADRLGRGTGRLRPIEGWTRPPAARRPDLRGWGDRELAAAWLGHATMLYRVAGVTVLIDPVWSKRVGVDLGVTAAGPARRQRAAVPIADLPRVDLILLTHAHFDHLDRPTLARLPKDAMVVTSAGVADLVNDLGFREVSELAHGESADVGGVSVTSLPVKHWGPRVFYDDWRGYGAFRIEGGGRSVLHAGDTALTNLLDGSGPHDLGAFGIGAYDPYIEAHATPEQAVAMAEAAGCRHLAAYHHTTFRLSREPDDEPRQRLREAARPGLVVVDTVGDVWSADAVGG